MNSKTQSRYGVSLLLLGIIFVALVMLSNGLLKGMRADLTEHGLYTISQGTRNILADIDEPITLRFFFSDKASASIPLLRDYARRVREVVEELAQDAHGKIILKEIDPIPFSEQEDQASSYGLQGAPIGQSGDKLYFGLVGTNALDTKASIPFFQPDKEPFLEYDLAQLIYSLVHPDKPVVGLMSKLPINGGFDKKTQRISDPWVITNQMRQVFSVRNVADDASAIDKDIKLLVVVHPTGLSDKTQWAIDQFVMGGGRLIVFVDPMSEMDRTASQFGGLGAGSDLPKLFKAWGIKYDPGQVLLDRGNAMTVSLRQGVPPLPHPGILQLRGAALNQNDVISAQLNQVIVASAGAVDLADGSTLKMEPLLKSSADSHFMMAQQYGLIRDPKQLLTGFQATVDTYNIAARFTGKLNSAFPDKLPDGVTVSDDQRKKTSDGDVNIMVFADSDMLSDRLWVRVQNFLGQKLASAWANNGDLVINAMDNLTGSSDLISIRTRATSQRPFDVVNELKAKANRNFADMEQQLQQELQETEKRLNDLQTQRSQAGNLMLSAQQKQELDRFQKKRLEVRKKLRGVRRNLDRDIDRLGGLLKAINIVLTPLLVIAFGIFLWWRRRQIQSVEGMK